VSGQSQKKASSITVIETEHQLKWCLDAHSTDPQVTSQEQKLNRNI
jgi:hypothetical protein